MEIFKVENLSFSFPEQNQETLKNITFSVKRGEFVVIFGESGSGKTTLLKLLKKELKGSVMVESILILVVLIALVAIFKTQLMDLVGEIFEKITSEGLAI